MVEIPEENCEDDAAEEHGDDMLQLPEDEDVALHVKPPLPW